VQVTEDHVFFNQTTDTWSEIRYITPGDQLLSTNGDPVEVVGLDWDGAVTPSAFDLSVTNQHNYFITADHTSTPVVVHNADIGAFCGLPLKSEYAVLSGAADALDETARAGLTAAIEGLAETNPNALDELLQVLSTNPNSVDTFVARAAEFPNEIAAATKRGWSDDYLNSSILWTDEAIEYVGEGADDVTRTVRFRELGPGPLRDWGITSAHLDKHLLGNGELSLAEIDEAGGLGRWLSMTEELLTRAARRSAAELGPPYDDGLTRTFETIRGTFRMADDSKRLKFEIVLHVRDDGTYDFVTWLTSQS